MKTLLLLTIAIAVTLSGCSKASNENTESDPNEVLVEVNGKTLTRGEAARQMNARLGGPPPAELSEEQINNRKNEVFSQVVDQFVKKTLLLEEADKLNITATEDEINKGIAALKARTAKGQQPKGITKDGPAGDDTLRNEVITGIRIDKLLLKKIPVKEPTAAEVDAFIEKNREKLTHPQKGLMPRERVITLMKTRQRKEDLFNYLKNLQENADIKHSKTVIPPRYPK